eukprot:EC121331.1.p1 GENE.EC121331.1~~EC121331.1.p1  ORF type:complete len:201 (+),score=28.81 EC121331.1:56-604(+)
MVVSSTAEDDTFFVRVHGEIPTIDATAYRLKVSALSGTSLEYTLDDLKALFPRKVAEISLKCQGDPNANSTASWAGVCLRDLLVKAGVSEQGGYHVHFTGQDAIPVGEEKKGYASSVLLDKALSGEVLLAYEMNAAPLTQKHGPPLRVVVPDLTGKQSVKWLVNISVEKEPAAIDFGLCFPA